MSRLRRACIASVAAVACLGPGLEAQTPGNVLIVLADDLGVDFVGAYGEGASLPATPNIDALAARGVLFRNAWANPSCSPTRGCLMTGRYPFRTLIGRWIDYPHNSGTVGTLRPLEVTLPEVLRRAGGVHADGYIGKWHLNYQNQGLLAPNAIGGWTHFAGKLKGMGSSNYYSWERVVNGVAATSSVYATTQQVDDALAWIGSQNGPWFCYFACLAPHLPMHAPPAHLHSQNLAGLSTTTHRTIFYKAVIEALDTELGRLFRGLGPELADTHVIFLGDNGSVQNMAVAPFDPSRAKGSPYEGGLNVPLIIAGPAVTSPGREVGALVSSVDVFRTALELAGALTALPTWVVTDGVSMVPYLGAPNQPPLRDHVFSEEFTGDRWPAPNQRGHATARNDRYKLIHRYGGTDEFFDLVVSNRGDAVIGAL